MVIGRVCKFGDMVIGRVCVLSKGKWASRIVRLCVVGLELKGGRQLQRAVNLRSVCLLVLAEVVLGNTENEIITFDLVADRQTDRQTGR
jgi:hypothetical protein